MTGSSTTTTAEGSSDRGLPPRVATAIAAATDAVGRFGPANAETIAARLRKHAETAPAATTVVVVGETKRGRSTLVNALLDYPGLSPVQATGSSSTYVIVHAGPDTVDPHAVVVGEAGSEEITIGELPERLAADTGGVVDVFLPAPSLEGVVLVDTPGANGVGARRGNLTRRLATESGLVLFTIDAGSPISRPEVDLLSRLARDVELIAVVVTMSDKYAGSIDAVASATRSHLARESARLARLPIMAVSALAYEHAARLPGGEYRTLLESASGVPALRAQLAALTARAPLLRGANVLRSTRSLLTGFARVQELSLSVGESQTDPTPHDLLEQLRELQERRTRWPATLERDLSRLRRSVVTTVVAALREIHRQTEADLARIPLRDRAGYLTEVGSRLTDSVGDVFGDAGEHLRDGLGAIVDRATDGQVRVDDIVDLPPLALPDDWVPGFANLDGASHAPARCSTWEGRPPSAWSVLRGRRSCFFRSLPCCDKAAQKAPRNEPVTSRC